jgi:formylglycine-generating enzyme required for sulfatase activity
VASAWAGIPEPDLIFYGTVKIDGVLQTSGGPTALEVRQGGDVLPIPILATSPDPFFVARIPIESSQGGSAAGCLGFCLTLGGSASLWVTSPSLPGGELEVGLIELASRGRVVRQDVAASSVASDNDIDGDGVPDFRDNCINMLAGSSQLDSNGNGIGDACEGIDNPGLSYARISDAGNPADPTTGKGAVPYEFDITTGEVSNADYVEFLNAVAVDDPNGLYNELMGVDPRGGIVRDGIPGSYSYRVRPRMAVAPVGFVSWLDAARYVNWEENGRPTGPQGPSTTDTGAFDLTVTDAATLAIASGAARLSLPTEDEFYKAAYYDPTLGGTGYWLYPTQSDSPPTNATATPDGRVANPGAEVANYDAGADWNGQDGNVTAVGTATSTSYYGSFDLAGNVEEWLANDAEAGGGGLQRVVRGGGFLAAADQLASTAGSSIRDEVLRDPLREAPDTGFRMVPEPGFLSLLLAGTTGLVALTRRRVRTHSGESRRE